MDKLPISKDNTALLVIDMLDHFSKEADSDYRTRVAMVIERISILRTTCHKLNIPVIYVNSHYESVDEYYKSGLSKKYPPHAIAGTPDAEVVPELKPASNDYVVPKTANSGFFRTNLEELLTRLEKTSLVFAGVHTHVCVLLTAADANYRNFDVFAVSDCVTASTLERHAFGLSYIERHFGYVLTSEHLIKLLSSCP